MRIEIANVVKVLADRWKCNENAIRVSVEKLKGTVVTGPDIPLKRENMLKHFDGKKFYINFTSRSGEKRMTVVGKIDCDLVQKDGKTMASHIWCRVPNGNSAGIYDVQIEYDDIKNLVIEKQLTELCTVRWDGELLPMRNSDEILIKAVELSEKTNESDIVAE